MSWAETGGQRSPFPRGHRKNHSPGCGGSVSPSCQVIARSIGSIRRTTTPSWKMRTVPVDSETAAMMVYLNLGDVESAESSTRLFANIVADKKRRIMDEQDG